MPNLNRQTLINLLIDSPLREPIKINLIDIVNNTKKEDLPKTFSSIKKELEIYKKATSRRLKLADQVVEKLNQKSSAKEAKTPLSDKHIEDPVGSKKYPTGGESTQSGTNDQQPKTKDQQPEPKTPNPKPKAKNPQPTVKDLQPKANDQKPKTNKLPPIHDQNSKPEPKTSNPKPTTKDPQPKADNQKPTAKNPQPKTQAKTDNQQPKTETDISQDEATLAEIQKELETLKNSADQDANQPQKTNKK